ncbi:MAG: 4Fe-4S dicluster domain-containing protein [Nitrosomonadales bacterium]
MKRSTDHADCSGCSLCLLVCPMWRQSRDIAQSAHGYAKALQHGATVNEIAAEVWSCTLCGACDPVCPEQMDVTGMIYNLRSQLDHSPFKNTLKEFARWDLPPGQESLKHSQITPHKSMSSTLFLPNPALRAHPKTLVRAVTLLASDMKISVCEDDAADISLALEIGEDIPSHRLNQFLALLKGGEEIIVTDGLLMKHLKQWLPEAKIISLGEALSRHASVRRNLKAADLYVIEPRAYHADYQRLVKYYDQLQMETGSAFNLDLQRIAIPATSRSLPQRLGLIMSDDDQQARWLLQGRAIERIVVESLEDQAALAKVTNVLVVHLADLSSR